MNYDMLFKRYSLVNCVRRAGHLIYIITFNLFLAHIISHVVWLFAKQRVTECLAFMLTLFKTLTKIFGMPIRLLFFLKKIVYSCDKTEDW